MPGILPAPVTSADGAVPRRLACRGRAASMSPSLTLTAPGFALDAKGGVQLGEPGQSPGLTHDRHAGADAGAHPAALLAAGGGARHPRLDRPAIFSPAHVGPIAFETHFTPGMMDQPMLPDDVDETDLPGERRGRQLYPRPHPSDRRGGQRHPHRRHLHRRFHRRPGRQSGGDARAMP